MSLNCTPSRAPLQEIGVNANRTPSQNPCSLTPHRKGRTPKTSPGPALLLAIRLSAKKEHLKNPPLLEFEDKENTHEENSPEASGVQPFRQLLLSETRRITALCDKWDTVLSQCHSALGNSDEVRPSDVVLGDIRTTVGQGRLIMRERFHQFQGLVDNCEFGTSEKPVTCQDLQGFWDMVYFQVEDVDGKFALLDKCRSSNWDVKVLNAVPPESCKLPKKKPVRKRAEVSKSSETSKLRRDAFAKKRAEARKRLASVKAEIKRAQQEKETTLNEVGKEVERVTFDAGFFKIDSPIKSPHVKALTPSQSNMSPREKSLRKQICTPGSITKTLCPVAKNSPSVCINTTERCTKKYASVSENKTEVFKKLEFSQDVAQVPLANDCTVEILLDDTTPNNKTQDPINALPDPGNKKEVDRSANIRILNGIDCRESSNASTSFGTESFAEEHSGNVNVASDGRTETFIVENSSGEVDSDGQSGIGTDVNGTDPDASNLSILIDEAAKNIEKASEILSSNKETPCRENESAMKEKSEKKFAHAETSVTPSIKKDEISPNKSQNLLQDTLEKMLSQMETLQKLNIDNRKTPKRHSSELEKLRSDVESLRSQNFKLKISLEEKREKAEREANLMELILDQGGEPDSKNQSDVAYKPHYFRLLAKVKLLEAELGAYHHLQNDLFEVKAKILIVADILDKKTKSINEYGDRIKQREAELKEAEEKEHNELRGCTETINNLKSELREVQEKLDSDGQLILERDSLLASLQLQYGNSRAENEKMQSDMFNLREDNSSLIEQKSALEKRLDAASNMYNEERVRAEALQEKVERLGQEVGSAFKEFNTIIEKRDEIIASQQKQIDDLSYKNKALQDKVETLEYVEDEMRSLQEQLADTERTLEASASSENKLKAVVREQSAEIATLTCDLEKNKLEHSDLQEELDVAKAEAHYMVQQREEELVYGSSGLTHILKMMQELDSRLRGMIRREISQEEGTDNAGQCQELSSCSSESSSISKSSDEKSTGSIIWRVDKAAEVFQYIITACADVQLQFQKEIENLEFQNSVLHKQLNAAKEKLMGFSKEENELEKVLKKRIKKLVAEADEKSTKLEDNGRVMRMLSDQNVELTKYKVKYEELMDEVKGSRKHRPSKRRSSSVGALKFLA